MKTNNEPILGAKMPRRNAWCKKYLECLDVAARADNLDLGCSKCEFGLVADQEAFQKNMTPFIKRLTKSFVGPKAAAGEMGITVSKLYRWQLEGKGPQAYKHGSRYFYRISDIENFMNTARGV